MIVFFDTSALAKRYLEEAGSERVVQILGDAARVGLSPLCQIEIVSALSRRYRAQDLSLEAYRRARLLLDEDLGDFAFVQVAGEVILGALNLLEAWPLRASDALHVASAMHWSADLFVSADRRQCAAARGAGLQVEELTP